MNIIALVQARMGSARLPMKSLLSLNGVPLIDWVIRRLRKSALLTGIFAAIPDTPLDRILGARLGSLGVPVFAGSETDVLGRMARAAEMAQASLIVRVCADNPFIWAPAVDRLIEFYLDRRCDYAWNHIPRNNRWPDGLGAEIVAASLLRELGRKAALPSQREHCFNYIWDNSQEFTLETFDPSEAWLQRPDIKLDIDCPQDYLRLATLNLTPEADASEIIDAWDCRQQTERA